jgi:hypothetical protein
MAGVGLGFGCNLDLHTGAILERGIDAAATSVGDAALDSSPETTMQSAPDGAVDSAPESFIPTMFVTIDGVPKRYRLSGLYSMDSIIPGGVRIEFSTGVRDLGSEATPGEFYSEVWLVITTGATAVPGSYSCPPAGADPAVAPPLVVAWSFNHILASRRDYSTSASGGPCAATLEDFGTKPGDRLRGTFSGTVDGGHTLSDGVFDLVVPTLVPIAGSYRVGRAPPRDTPWMTRRTSAAARTPSATAA